MCRSVTCKLIKFSLNLPLIFNLFEMNLIDCGPGKNRRVEEDRRKGHGKNMDSLSFGGVEKREGRDRRDITCPQIQKIFDIAEGKAGPQKSGYQDSMG